MLLTSTVEGHDIRLFLRPLLYVSSFNADAQNCVGLSEMTITTFADLFVGGFWKPLQGGVVVGIVALTGKNSELVFGRASTCDVVLDHASISRQVHILAL